MDRVIFSLYIDIDDENLEMDMGPFPGDDIERTVRVKQEYTKYRAQIIENHRSYAQLIGVDYINYGRTASYCKFRDQFPGISEYNVINFYKFYLMEQLAKDYDEVLYVDLDVVFNTDKDFFAHHDLSAGIHLSARDMKDRAMRYVCDAREYNRRDPGIKWLICFSMDQRYDGPIYNTGVVAATAEQIRHLDFTNQIDDYVDRINLAEAESFLVDELKLAFDYNNEAMFSHRVWEQGISCVDTTGPWNFNVRNLEKIEYDDAEKFIIHFIQKDLHWYFGDSNGTEPTTQYRQPYSTGVASRGSKRDC